MRLNDIVPVQLRWFNARRPNAVKNKTLASTGKHRLHQSTLEDDDDRHETHKSIDCVNEQ